MNREAHCRDRQTGEADSSSGNVDVEEVGAFKHNLLDGVEGCLPGWTPGGSPAEEDVHDVACAAVHCLRIQWIQPGS